MKRLDWAGSWRFQSDDFPEFGAQGLPAAETLFQGISGNIELVFPRLGAEKNQLTVDVEAADGQLLAHNKYTFQLLAAGKREHDL